MRIPIPANQTTAWHLLWSLASVVEEDNERLVRFVSTLIAHKDDPVWSMQLKEDLYNKYVMLAPMDKKKGQLHPKAITEDLARKNNRSNVCQRRTQLFQHFRGTAGPAAPI